MDGDDFDGLKGRSMGGGHDFPAGRDLLGISSYTSTVHFYSFQVPTFHSVSQLFIPTIYTSLTTSSFSTPNNLLISAIISTISFDNCPVTRAGTIMVS